MTVRVKILAISAVLLLLFAVVLVGSVVMQKQSSDKVAAIIDFQLPLTAAIADLDVATFEYELSLERALRRPEVTEADRRALDTTKARITADFERTEALLARALVDPRTDGAERLVLARAERSLVYLRRLEAPFLALGDEVLAAHTGARPAEALALSLRVNKVYATTVILAEETHRLAQHAIEARELDVVIVAGKSEPVRIFELVGRAGEVEPSVLELRDLYVDGLEAYRRQDWEAAERRFTECLRLRPDDGPAGVLRGRSVGFRAAPPPDWDGVWRLAEK